MRGIVGVFFVICACHFFPVVDTNSAGKWKFYKNTFRFMIRIHSRPVKSYFETVSSAKEEPDKPKEVWYKRGVITKADNETGLFRSEIQNFPVDGFIGDAVFKMFGKDGILAKGGFGRVGVVHRNGEGKIFLHKSFFNRTNFLHLLEKAVDSPFNSDVLSLVTQLLLSPEDLKLLLQFEGQLIAMGNFRSEDPCSPKMRINYRCCSTTTDRVLRPKFATLRIDVD